MHHKNFRLGTKLSLAFGFITLLTVLLSGIAWAQLRSLHDASEAIATNWLPSVQAIGDMRVAANRARRTESEVFLPATAEVGERFRAELASRMEAFAQSEKVYVPMITPGEEARLYAAFKDKQDRYVQTQKKLLAMPATDRDAMAAAFLGESEKSFDDMTATLGELAVLNRKGADAAEQDGLAAFSSAQITLAIFSLAIVLIAAALSVVITRLITHPMKRAVAVAQAVSQGDLTLTVDTSGKDETAQLMVALMEMRHSLQLVVATVRSNSESVASASLQIAQGNSDLSGRTEQQASALEETAASMEELSSTVRNNADSAQKASELATGTSREARHSGESVEALVKTMKTIDDASRHIAEIIGVIDGIAFQTNILALNAAVEAARAGEQGRGFAVVATEVRSLAKRSADAAKQIKDLIQTSEGRVKEGSDQAAKVGTAMSNVVTAIERVATLVEEISTATREQSAGIAQVGEAISQMDQTTQQNAALVEESAAAAASLKQQAEQLVGSVAVFKLDGGTAAPRHASPQPQVAAPGTSSPARAPVQAARKSLAAPQPKARELATADDWSSF
ncbi:HAMP domain-containing protein [Xylophilus rhododendri]|uniref:HAMP domain-containing protein n=1 Tax=Xylophilus rhododendri TaxID=2697032 RepID=A0A857J0L5_9BURK|nr:methyl-accepting chemotaxis protein [Xylophilus rhododendri]QHI96729.1 HAMP domain-containing protein [Xylophilus rhododendri]